MIYADYNATAPCSSDHIQRVMELLLTQDGNPSSTHFQGRRAKSALEKARRSVAWHFGAEASEIIFTSGATEANNQVIMGVLHQTEFPFADTAQERLTGPSKMHIVISSGEHSSVLAPCEMLVNRSKANVSVAPLLSSGVISPDGVLACITKETALVSLLYVNNETGIKSDLMNLLPRIRAKNPRCHVHVDAVQALGKIDLKWMKPSGVDSATISGHKIGGLKGIGALFLNKSARLGHFLVGGGQERGRRAGTENMPGVLSLGLKAEELQSVEHPFQTVHPIWERLWDELSQLPRVFLHGAREFSTRNTINFHVEGVSGELLMLKLDAAGIAVSTGSACSSGVAKPSHVLLAMGLTDEQASNSIRISLGPQTLDEEASAIVIAIKKILESK